MLGLIGSPNSAAGLVEMRALLRDPDFPVSSMFLRTMSYLPLRAGDAPDVLQRQQQENMEGGPRGANCGTPIQAREGAGAEHRNCSAGCLGQLAGIATQGAVATVAAQL
jgi:hypothetical protein